MAPKPNTTWYFFARDNNVLRHGHAFTKVDPKKIQWHPASMRHPSDTMAHDIARSWDMDVALEHWSIKPDQLTLSDAEKREMVLRAQANHDGRPYLPPAPNYTPPQPPSYNDDTSDSD